MIVETPHTKSVAGRLGTDDTWSEYLSPSDMIDFDCPAVQAQADALKHEGDREEDRVRRVYEFVRDEIAHSWDIQSNVVTATASDVLEQRHGICYAKSHLLAALLRAVDIPSGICYQRTTLGDTPETGHCIHALNAVYLSSLGRWVRLDARGNKPGVNAQFSADMEQLAFPIRPHYGELDYWHNFAMPHPSIVETLTRSVNCQDMYSHGLPSHLDGF